MCMCAFYSLSRKLTQRKKETLSKNTNFVFYTWEANVQAQSTIGLIGTIMLGWHQSRA